MSNLSTVRASHVRLRGSIFSTCFAAIVLLVATLGLAGQQARAADAATGTIEGRVLNMGTGQYLSHAVLQINGTALTAVTNEYGEYTIRNVPEGTAKVTATFTGQQPVTMDVKVEAGKAVMQDFALNKGNIVLEDGTTVLDVYTVSDKRYQNAQEIAINEERRSINAKDVVASDSLGYIPGGNIGEFVKYLPGVQTEYGGADAFGGAGLGGINPSAASQVSIRGFGAAETAVTIDGMAMSGVGPGALTRAIGLDMMSINNASRIEVIKVPTPDMDAGAGGAINLVTKSAFEYAKPTYTVEMAATYNTSDTKIFSKQPGPANKKTYHTLPSGSISVAVPVSKNFGFSVSLAAANSYSANYKIQAAWQNTNSTAYGNRTGTNLTVALAGLTTTTGTRAPRETPYSIANWTTASITATRTTVYYNVGNLADGRLSTLDNPFLRQATDNQNPWSERKVSASLKLDWKPVKGMSVSASYTGSTYEGINVDRRLQVTPQGPMEWGPDYLIGRPYELAIAGVQGSFDGRNALEQEVTARDKSGVTHTGYFKMNYARGPWSIGASASKSRTSMDLDDLKNGHMYKVALAATIGQVIFRGIQDGVPGTVEIYDRNKAALDYRDLTKWNFAGVDVGSAKSAQSDMAEEYKIDVKRDLDFLPFKSSFKIGGTRKVKEQAKSGLGTGYKMRYIGTDLTTTDFVSSITDTEYTRTSGLGFALNQQWGDTYKMYKKFVETPNLFNPDYDVSYSTSNYRSVTNQQKSLREESDSVYAMLDGSFFNNRLSVVTGARRSYSRINGRQPFTDGKWNYVKNPDGTIYRDSFYLAGVKFDGSNSTRTNADLTTTQVRNWIDGTTGGVNVEDAALKARLAAAGITYPSQLILNAAGATATTGNSMEAQRRALYIGEVNRKRTNPITPSVIVAYNITDDIVFKPSWSREVSLPPLDGGNGGTAGLLGGVTITENEPRISGTGGDGTISISNAGLKPKTVDSWNFQLAWYNKYGKVGVNYFYKNINNEWITDSYTNTSGDFQRLMSDNGFDGEGNFYNWTIRTTDNSNEKSKSSGYEIEGRENLGFLGNFMGHFNVFGNFSKKNLKQSNRDGVVAMTAFAENTWAGGVNVSAYRASLTLKVVYQDELWEKAGTVNYVLGQDTTTTPIQLYNVTPETYRVKVDFDYQLSKIFTLFVSGDNITNTRRLTRQRDALGIKPKYSWVTSNYEFGVNVTAGVRAQF